MHTFEAGMMIGGPLASSSGGGPGGAGGPRAPFIVFSNVPPLEYALGSWTLNRTSCCTNWKANV